jgi:formate-dependent nitrite reductase membrane component NrfD
MLSGTWLILWILVVLSLIPSLLSLAGRRTAPISGMTSALVVIVGVFLLRFVIIFGAQF